MKKFLSIITISIFIFMFSTSCSKQISFDGSRTSNNVQFIMDYKVLNETKSHKMELEQGAIIDVFIEDKSGRLDILVENVNGDKIYRGDNASSSNFSIEIPEKGTYLFSVTGYNANGSVSFKVAE